MGMDGEQSLSWGKTDSLSLSLSTVKPVCIHNSCVYCSLVKSSLHVALARAEPECAWHTAGKTTKDQRQEVKDERQQVAGEQVDSDGQPEHERNQKHRDQKYCSVRHKLAAAQKCFNAAFMFA
jgi:hypothetical protein